jgi:hypothetical protein
LDLALGNFVKFGVGRAIHHGRSMSAIFPSIAIMNSLLKGVHLPCPNSSHDPPLCTIQDAIGYVVM